jgi:nucleotide-binding universal stress UspA family protein
MSCAVTEPRDGWPANGSFTAGSPSDPAKDQEDPVCSTILVPLDGSALADRALPYAIPLARASHARLSLVRAALAHTLPGADPSEAQVAVVQRAEHELEATAESLRSDGLTVETHVYYDEAARAIVDAAERQAVDLVVMSTHGRGGLGRWVYGSVADRVLRRMAAPVLLVPAAAEPARATNGPLRVVVPLDGSPLAEEVLDPVRLLAVARGAELLLLRVVEPPVPLEVDGEGYLSLNKREAELAEAQRYLDSIAGRLRAGGVMVTARAVVEQAVPTIVGTAADFRADLIAMATHGRGGLARFVLGSVATGVLHRASTPLLLVRPTMVREEKASTAPATPAARTPVMVVLSHAELEAVEQGLKALLRDAELEAGARVRETPGAQVVGDLLARLRQADSDAASMSSGSAG